MGIDRQAQELGVEAPGFAAGIAKLPELLLRPDANKSPAWTQSWRRNWEHVVPFFAYPESVRRITYTTNGLRRLVISIAICDHSSPTRRGFSLTIGLRAVQADEDVVRTSRVCELERRVRELERLLGRKTVEVEILKEALDVARVKKPSLQLPSWNDRKDGSP